MSRKAFDDLKAALEEAITLSKGEDIGARAHIPSELDARRIRKKTKLTQEEFAAQFGFNVARLRIESRAARTRMPRCVRISS